MKALELIQNLQEVTKNNPDAEVVISLTDARYLFTGLSVDDDENIELFPAAGDDLA